MAKNPGSDRFPEVVPLYVALLNGPFVGVKVLPANREFVLLTDVAFVIVLPSPPLIVPPICVVTAPFTIPLAEPKKSSEN